MLINEIVMRTGVEHILWLMLILSAVAVVTKYIRLPYAIALVVTGLVIALLPDQIANQLSLPLSSDIILYIFLPALLFEGAYNLDFARLWTDIRTISVFAVFGVLLTMLLVGVTVHFMLGLDWSVSLLFGAIVAATDPIAVLAMFRRLGTSPRLSTLVESESLFNDGTSLVAFSIILGVIMGGRFDLAGAAFEFIFLSVGGLVVGALAGAIASLLLARINDHLIETVLTLVLAYGSYIIAEGVKVSGVIAVVTAGLVLGNFGAARAMSPSTRVAVNYTWDLLGFLANSLIFILIGLQVRIEELGRFIVPVIVAAVGTLLARALTVYGLNWLVLKRINQPLPQRWLVVITWGGLRGALALAMAYSIPATLLPQALRDQLLVMTFGVILFTLLGQGLTIQPLLARLGMTNPPSEPQLAYERSYGLLQSTAAARRQLAKMLEQGEVSRVVAARLAEQYDESERRLRLRVHQLQAINEELLTQEQQDTERQLLQVEKNTLRGLAARGSISPTVQRELFAELDRQLQQLTDKREGNGGLGLTHNATEQEDSFMPLDTRLKIKSYAVTC